MRRSITNLLAPAAVALATLTLTACDTGGPGPESTLLQRVDTLQAVVGETVRYDLEALFAEVDGAPLTFSVLRQPDGGTAWVEGTRGERLVVQARVAGLHALLVEARGQDDARVRAQVVVRVGEADLCTPVGPVADYFPLAVGTTWTYRSEGYVTGTLPASWDYEVTWEVTAESPCTDGRRTYTVTETLPDGTARVVMEPVVEGDSVYAVGPAGYTLHSVRRLYPAASSSADRTEQEDTSPYDQWSATFGRGVGIRSMRAYAFSGSSGGYQRGVTYTLLSGPAPGRQNATAAWRR